MEALKRGQNRIYCYGPPYAFLLYSMLLKVTEEPLMICGGARAKAVKKNSTATRPGKKNSTQRPGRKTQILCPRAPPDH